MTTKRSEEIYSSIRSFSKDKYSKGEVLPELLSLQTEIINLTFNDNHAENGNLRLWGVEHHLQKLNEECSHIADDLLSDFMADCKVICSTIAGEVSGQQGEFKANRSLETLRCRHKVLRNVEMVSGDHRTELDFVVVTEKAVFIVEVKNTAKDICIDERGNYCRVGTGGKLSFDKNIGEKMNEKEYLLRYALSKAGIENINIVSLVVFTNSFVTCDNRYPYIDICYLSDLPHRIGGYIGERIYSGETIAKIVDTVNESRCQETYPLPIDMDKFKRTFAQLTATLEYAKDCSQIEECKTKVVKVSVEHVEPEAAPVESGIGRKTVSWFKRHKVASHAVASIAGVALTTVAVVIASSARK